MSNSTKVGEIFQAAGSAFNQLGDLTMQLQGSGGRGTGSGAGGAKWTDREITMLHTAVHNFASELKAVSETIRNRTVDQIKGALEKKAYQEAGLKFPPKPIATASKEQLQSPETTSQAPTTQPSTSAPGIMAKPNANVTLNMLNAPENEVDVEGLGPPASNFEAST